jgi:hypothetical protein
MGKDIIFLILRTGKEASLLDSPMPSPEHEESRLPISQKPLFYAQSHRL